MNVERAASAALLGLLVVALAVRLVALDVPGHSGDVQVMTRWAERMAAVGPARFYDGSGAIYPALLYLLWPLGAVLDDGPLRLAIKGLSIPFDLAIGMLLFAVGRGLGPVRRLLAPALYLLNPAALLAGPLWGQVDSAGTLPFLAAVTASASRRHALAAAMAALATLVKPQFALAVLLVGAAAWIDARHARSRAPLLASIAGAAAAYVVVTLPLALDPVRYASLVVATAGHQPATSLHAFNPWGLLVGFDRPDDPYVGLGAALLIVGLSAALIRLRRGQALGDMLATATLLVLAFYFLPTRVHERYLFPATVVLAPLAAVDGRLLAAYVALSAGFAGTLLYGLERTTRFPLPEPWASALTSPAGVWTIGLVVIACGAAIAWRLATDARYAPSAASGRSRPNSFNRTR